MDYSDDLKVFDTFNRNSVEYLVVGGTAVSFYGEPRKSKHPSGKVVDIADFDLWYYSSYENYYKMLNAIEQLGKKVERHRDNPTPNPREDVFRFEFETYTIDIIPVICAPLNFRESFNRRTILERDGIEIPFISLEDLIKDKIALGRPKDIDDIENLRRNNPSAPSS